MRLCRREWNMFDTLSDRLSGILDKITGRGALSESDVEDALREVRRALLEADVALEVVRTFTDKVRDKAVGAEIVKSVKPGQMVVKIVHDAMVETLGGGEASALNLRASPPVAILMVGLQGSGKTTGCLFDAVSCATQMPPGKDGVWAATQIRELDPAVEIVICTAYSDADVAEVEVRAFLDAHSGAMAAFLDPGRGCAVDLGLGWHAGPFV